MPFFIFNWSWYCVTGHKIVYWFSFMVAQSTYCVRSFFIMCAYYFLAYSLWFCDPIINSSVSAFSPARLAPSICFYYKSIGSFISKYLLVLLYSKSVISPFKYRVMSLDFTIEPFLNVTFGHFFQTKVNIYVIPKYFPVLSRPSKLSPFLANNCKSFT